MEDKVGFGAIGFTIISSDVQTYVNDFYFSIITLNYLLKL